MTKWCELIQLKDSVLNPYHYEGINKQSLIKRRFMIIQQFKKMEAGESYLCR